MNSLRYSKAVQHKTRGAFEYCQNAGLKAVSCGFAQINKDLLYFVVIPFYS